MLIGAHTVLYSTDPEATRRFLRDVLDLAAVDAGNGWLIFALPPGEVAVHPDQDGPPGDAGRAGRHELYLMCDDIEATVTQLQDRGARISGPIQQQRWGRLVSLQVPGGIDVGLYQPEHPVAITAGP